MNKVELTGRLTKDPDVIYSSTQTGEQMAVARYYLAVERRNQRNNNNSQNADFVPCVAFGKQAEFVRKYLKQGIKIGIVGRIQTGSYLNREGQTVYTVEVVVEEHEFEESRKSAGGGIEASNERDVLLHTSDNTGTNQTILRQNVSDQVITNQTVINQPMPNQGAAEQQIPDQNTQNQPVPNQNIQYGNVQPNTQSPASDNSSASAENSQSVSQGYTEENYMNMSPEDYDNIPYKS